MKRFIGLLKKEFYHIFRDKRTIMILFGMPIVQILIFGYVIKNEVSEVDIAVLDYSRDETTIALKNKLEASGYFNVLYELQSPEEIHERFKEGKIKEVIVFPEGFSGDLTQGKSPSIQLILDATDPNYAQIVGQYTEVICLDFGLAESQIFSQSSGISIQNRMFLMITQCYT